MGTLVTTRSVLHLRDVGLDDVPTVGGKGAGLGELLRARVGHMLGAEVVETAFALDARVYGVHPCRSWAVIRIGLQPRGAVDVLDGCSGHARESKNKK